jgi:hypothetical protein
MTSPRLLILSPTVLARLTAQLPDVAAQTIAAVIDEVPGYSALDPLMGARIGTAVQMALGGFLKLARQRVDSDPSSPLAPAVDAAYALGRGEARSGRTMDALLAAYRVGARVAWRELAAVAVAAGLPAETTAHFAELVFAYIDQLSAASVTGHADELATTGRVRERYLDNLTRAVLTGAPARALEVAAELAKWDPPVALAALLLPEAQAHQLRSHTDSRTLLLSGDLPGVQGSEAYAVLLIPNLDAHGRSRLADSLHGRQAVVGPTKPWTDAAVSYRRVVRARALVHPDHREMIDTEFHLPELILSADSAALDDLRASVLAPLTGMRDAAAEKLVETLRAWLLYQGRRDAMATALFVHPQTVRYRMGQLREVFGARLEDPREVLALTIALGTINGESRSPVRGLGR